MCKAVLWAQNIELLSADSLGIVSGEPVFENLAVANQAEDTDANPSQRYPPASDRSPEPGVSFGNYPLEFSRGYARYALKKTP